MRCPRLRPSAVWWVLFLGLVLPNSTLAVVASAAPGGLENLLEQRPKLGPFTDLRQWASGEYDYVRTYRLLDRAYARLRSGDLDAAAADFEALLNIHPDHPQLPLYLADIHLRRGDRARAVQILVEYLERHPGSGYAAATLGYLYLDRGQRETAVAYLERALAAYGEQPAATAVRANLAELAYAAEDYPRALDLYLKLGRELLGEPLLAYRIGLTQRHLGHAAEAAESFREALATPGLDAETSVRAQLELAQALRESGDLPAATRAVEHLLAGGGPIGGQLLARAKRQLYVLYLAAENCPQALRLYPDLDTIELPPLTRAAAGYCQMRLGRPERAVRIFRRVLATADLPPAETARVRLELAGLLAQRGELARAATVLEQLSATPGVEPVAARRATLQLAEIRVAMGQTSAARGLLDSLSAATTDEYTALRVYRLYLDLGLTAAARDHLLGLVASKDVAPALRTRAEQELAFLLLRGGDDAAAAEVLRQLATRPGAGARQRARAAWVLAELYVRTGPADTARRWARQAWQTTPEPALGLLLARLETQLGDLAAAEELLLTVRRDSAAGDALRQRATIALGTLYLRQGRDARAREAFREVLAADPRDSYALASLVELAKRDERGEEYLALAARLRRLDPKAVVDAEVAATAAELGEYRRALELYRKLLADEADPAVRADMLRHMGFSALRLGDRTAAVGYLRRYLDLVSEPDPQVLEQLALVYIYEGDCAAALGPLEELVRRRGDVGDTLRTARCQEQVRNLPAAAAGYRRVLDLSYDADAALALAGVQQRQGQLADAVATLEALAEWPDAKPDARFEALVTLSTLYEERGQEGLRRDAARRAVAVLPDDASPEQALYALVLGGRDDPRLEAYVQRIRDLEDVDQRQAQALRLSALYETVGEPARALDWAVFAVAAKPTAMARFRRGVLLYQAGQFDAARGDFDAALDSHPEAALYLAYVHSARGRNGLAIDVLEQALQRQGTPAELAARMRRQLAQLYLAEERPGKSLAFSERAGPEDADLWQVRARSLLLLGRDHEALAAALRARATVPVDRAAPVHLLLGDIYRRQERWQDADREYARYLSRHPNSGAVLYLAAECRRRLGDPDGSRELLRRALEAQPGQPSYLLDYGYALSAAGEAARAGEVFDTYLASYPEAVEILEQSAYLELRRGRNETAAGRFRAAIDQRRLRAAHAEGEDELRRQEQHLDALRRTVWDLEKRFSVAGYLLRPDLGGSGSTAGYRGIIPGQLGLEGGWRPPRIGFRDHRIFELSVRLLGSFEENSWVYDAASTQLALGAKYKPFAGANLALSLERLIKLGGNSEDNWLLRGMFSRDWGRQLRFLPGWGHAGYLYAELGRYFEAPKRTAGYFEARDGPRWALSPAWSLIPHGVIDGRWDAAQDPGGTYLEGGLGLELLGGWAATEHRANAWWLSLYVQYKVGMFGEQPPGQDGKSYRGPTLGVAVRR